MGNGQSTKEIRLSYTTSTKARTVYPPDHTLVPDPIIPTEPQPHLPIQRQPSYALPENHVLPFAITEMNELKLRPVRRSLTDLRDLNGSQNSGQSTHSSRDSRRPLSVINASTFMKIYDANEDVSNHVQRSSSSASAPNKLHHKPRAPAPPSQSVPSTPISGKAHKNVSFLKKKKAPAPPPLGIQKERLYQKNSKNNPSQGGNRKSRKAPPPPTNQGLSNVGLESGGNSNLEILTKGSLVCRIEPSVRPPAEPPVDYDQQTEKQLSNRESSHDITLTAVVHNEQNDKPIHSISETPMEPPREEKKDIDAAMKRLRDAISNIRAASTLAQTKTKEHEEKLSNQESVTNEARDDVSEQSENSENSNEESEKFVFRRMSSLLQHDIIRAAQARPSKPCVIKQDFDKPKSFQQLFEDELSMAYNNREKRLSTGNLKQTPAQEPLIFSAKLGRVASKSELSALKETGDNSGCMTEQSTSVSEELNVDEEDQNSDSEIPQAVTENVGFPGAAGLRSLFSEELTPFEKTPENPRGDEIENKLNELPTEYKDSSKKKTEKNKFNSIKRIKKSFKSVIGSLGRASAKLQMKLYNEQSHESPSVLETDNNWTLGPSVKPFRKDLNEVTETDDQCEIGQETPSNSFSKIKKASREFEEGIACYNDEGKLVVVPQCEVVKIVKKHIQDTQQDSADREVEETTRYIYQPVGIGQSKNGQKQELVNGVSANTLPEPSSTGMEPKEVANGDAKSNYVLVPRDQLEKLMQKKDSQTPETEKVSLSQPASLKTSQSDEESDHGSDLKRGKKAKQNKRRNKKYVIADDSDEDDTVDVRRKSHMMPPPVGYYGNQHMYPHYPMTQVNGFPPGVMPDYAQQMQMASYQASLNNFHANMRFPSNAMYPGNYMMNPYSGMQLSAAFMNHGFQPDQVNSKPPQFQVPTTAPVSGGHEQTLSPDIVQMQSVGSVTTSENSKTVDCEHSKNHQVQNGPSVLPQSDNNLLQTNKAVDEDNMADSPAQAEVPEETKPELDEPKKPELEKKSSFTALITPRGYRPMNISLPKVNSSSESNVTHMW